MATTCRYGANSRSSASILLILRFPSRSVPPHGPPRALATVPVAGLMRGIYPDPDTLADHQQTDQPQTDRVFVPQMPADEREERYAGWRRAVAGVLAAVPPPSSGDHDVQP